MDIKTMIPRSEMKPNFFYFFFLILVYHESRRTKLSRKKYLYKYNYIFFVSRSTIFSVWTTAKDTCSNCQG